MGNNIKLIDKNFETSFEQPKDLKWFSINEFPFSIHGIYYSEKEKKFRRMPKDVADTISEGVSILSSNTAGGRLRFITDSPYIVLRAEEPFDQPFSHMTVACKCGFTVFVNNSYIGTIMPSYEEVRSADLSIGGNGTIAFSGINHCCNEGCKPYLAEIFFPLYSDVCNVYVGLKNGCVLEQPKDYKFKLPITFYGSSITQGGCASKSGDDYISRLSRKLDTEILNLGFSGNALAEPNMAKYISSIKSSIYVLDYDHNAPNSEHLKKTHFPLYQTIRSNNPNTPIVLMSMPTMEGYENIDWYKDRRNVIFDTLNKAKEQGDNNIYFIDCYGCFGVVEGGESGTVDGCHPNSLGFLRMYQKLLPLLEKLLYRIK